MYRYTLPPQHNTVPSYGYSSYPSLSTPSPRDRYLAAEAEARAAKAEYLATEAARREEQALRQRLAEIEQERQSQEAERQRRLRARHMQRVPQLPAYAPEYYQAEAEVPYYGHPAQRLGSCRSQPRHVSHPSYASYQQVPQPRASFAPPLGWEPRQTSQPSQTVTFEDLVNGLTQRAPTAPALAPRPKQEVPQVMRQNYEALSLEQLVNLLAGGEAVAAPAAKPAPPKAPTPLSASATQPTQSLEQLFNLFLGSAAQAQAPPRPASSSKPAPALSSSKPIAAAVPEPKKVEKSLKEQLEALLASLSDNYTTPSPAKSTAPSQPSFQLKFYPAASSTGKGKAKEVEQQPVTVSLSSALNTITNIQATFHNLESEFVLPAHLDFITPSDEDLSTPISAGGSYSSKLAFTSNNHPFRFYQQALGELLNKLDAVESHGNDELRKQRKVVVAQVEKALEELESEVEARWRSWVAKQRKEKTQTQTQTPSEEVVPRARRDSKGHVEVEEVEDEAVRQEREKRKSFSGSEPTSIIVPIEPEEVVPKNEVEEVKTVPIEELPPVFVSEPSSPTVAPYEVLHKEEEDKVQDAGVVVEVSEVEEEGDVEVEEELPESLVEPASSSLPEESAESTEPTTDEVVVEEAPVELAQVSTYPPTVYPPSESAPASSQVVPDPSESTATIRPLSPIVFATSEPTQDQSGPELQPESEESEFELSEAEGFLEASDSETPEKKRPAYKDQSDEEWSELEA